MLKLNILESLSWFHTVANLFSIQIIECLPKTRILPFYIFSPLIYFTVEYKPAPFHPKSYSMHGYNFTVLISGINISSQFYKQQNEHEKLEDNEVSRR